MVHDGYMQTQAVRGQFPGVDPSNHILVVHNLEAMEWEFWGHNGWTPFNLTHRLVAQLGKIIAVRRRCVNACLGLDALKDWLLSHDALSFPLQICTEGPWRVHPGNAYMPEWWVPAKSEGNER